MFTIRKTGRFEASHILEGHKGKCGRLHGHSYVFEIELEGEHLDEIGLLYDFGSVPIKRIERVYDHQHLNKLENFDSVDAMDIEHLKLQSTSAEHIALTIALFVKKVVVAELILLKQQSGSVIVRSVTVWETAKCAATYLLRDAK